MRIDKDEPSFLKIRNPIPQSAIVLASAVCRVAVRAEKERHVVVRARVADDEGDGDFRVEPFGALRREVAGRVERQSVRAFDQNVVGREQAARASVFREQALLCSGHERCY